MNRLDACQRQKLQGLVAFARQNSAFYQSHYRAVPPSFGEITDLPITTKSQLMDRFDDWVTDPAVTLASVQEFASSPARIGRRYLDRYAVWKSSGTSGRPGCFLHDAGALAVYDHLFAQRGWGRWIDPPALFRWMASGGRMACIAAVEDHFAAVSSWRRMVHDYPWFAPVMREYSVMLPLGDLVGALNDWLPAQLAAYPSVLALLARERAAGRLHLAPVLILAGGECLDCSEQERLEAAFGTMVHNIYACSECDYVAFGCRERWLHVNADWVVLEPVDSDYRPVRAGEASHTCLITNLANHIQPIIRYDLGDRILLRPDPCPCGNPLPAIQVEGRRNQVLKFLAKDGGEVSILPMAITTVLDTLAGLSCFQIAQSRRDALIVRCEFCKELPRHETVEAIKTSLKEYLSTQGVSGVEIDVSPGAPIRNSRSGKLEQVQVLA